jgi:hypothetical protein
MSAPNVPSGAVCSKCGAGVGRNEEGRVTCNGCNMATENCTCERREE